MTATEKPTYQVIGTRPIRHDGLEKVTGQARYSADVHLPGMLHGRVLRSPHAHARIVSIDTSRAEALPGVRAVVTGADMPPVSGRADEQAEGSYLNLGFASRNILAQDKALFRGHAIAAVAADTSFIADEALALITVEYEPLPPLLTAEDAMAPGAPIIIEGLKTRTALGAMAGISDADEPDSNVASAFSTEVGDPAAGFEQADIILEKDYSVGGSHQGYIEPQSATASWASDGQLTIWCSSQGHFSIRDLTAGILKIPQGSVRVVPMEIGGGFGAKLFPTIEPVAALLSRKAGRPVKITLSRADVFEAVGGTSAAEIHLRMGVTNEGDIVAAEARLVFEAGAFPGSPVGGAANCMFAPYDIPNARVEGFDVLVNKPKATAYRAPGAPAGAFAVESMLDEFCEQLGMDPIEFRLRNAAHEGTRRSNGAVMPRIGVTEVLEAARATPHWNSPLEGPNRGRGIALGFWGNAPGQASMVANVRADGTVALVEGSPDIGGTRATAAMMLAEALGIPAEDVRPSIGDTDSIGFTSLTGGSSTAFKQGWAATATARDLIEKLCARAAVIWSVEPSGVSYHGGAFHSGDRSMTFKELAAQLNRTGGPVSASASVSPATPGPAIGAHIADIEVDSDTGKVQVLRFTAIIDAGTAVHPSYVEGQMQGGAAQGIGWALTEEYVYNTDGRMENSTFLDYRMPTSLDLPPIETQIVEVPNPGHPYGVRGVGEVVIVPPLAALGNAVAHATGRHLPFIPMSATRVLEALIQDGTAPEGA